MPRLPHTATTPDQREMSEWGSPRNDAVIQRTNYPTKWRRPRRSITTLAPSSTPAFSSAARQENKQRSPPNPIVWRKEKKSLSKPARTLPAKLSNRGKKILFNSPKLNVLHAQKDLHKLSEHRGTINSISRNIFQLSMQRNDVARIFQRSWQMPKKLKG